MSGRANKVGAEMQDSNAPNKSFFSEKAIFPQRMFTRCSNVGRGKFTESSQRKRLSRFQSGISVVKKIKPTFVTGAAERLAFSES